MITTILKGCSIILKCQVSDKGSEEITKCVFCADYSNQRDL